MKIAVLIKEVPDTYGARSLDESSGLADRTASDRVLDEISERAIEVALTHADLSPDADVSVILMGPEVATPSIRKGLAMGADRAVHVSDAALAGADVLLTAQTLAAALHQLNFDLVICGDVSTDGSGGVIPAMIAEHLGFPHATKLSSVVIEHDAVSGSRITESGVFEITAPLPAVISITEALPDARFPNFKGIMAAKKKPIETLTLSDLGVTPPSVDDPQSIMLAVEKRPARAAGSKVIDDGSSAEALADFLVKNSLI